MIYAYDLDQTLCDVAIPHNYDTAYPIQERVDEVNNLYDAGHEIIIFTARGMSTYKNDVAMVYDRLYYKTKKELEDWGVKHHKLIMGKPSYDYFVDDKAYNSEDWFKKPSKRAKVGFIAGAFDVIHPGYIHMFQECKKHCDYLIVGIHTDPSVENGKLKPILSLTERGAIISSIRYVDEHRYYATEASLLNILRTTKIDVRFLGWDYVDKLYFTGKELNIPVHYIPRVTGWSTTKFKEKIAEQISSKKTEDSSWISYH
jgi:cytidyltransferase-like protein